VIILESGRPLLFFDGECNLCNGIVQFIIRHDKKKLFLFATLQSGIGERAKEEVQSIYHCCPDTVILFYKDKYYIKSDAAIMVFRLLGGFWSLLSFARVMPRGMRNGLYEWISRNRYKWFGKRNECMVPTPELQSRFIS